MTFQERQLLEKLNKEGKSLTQMVRALNFNPSTITREFRRNGGRSIYTAENGQKSYENRTFYLPGATNQTKRIESLFMMLDILSDEIKTLKKRLDSMENK